MGITYKEFAWLIDPNKLDDSNIYGGVNGCPGDIADGENKLYDCMDPGIKECTECWNREIPYPVIAEAVRDTMSLAGFNIKKGNKFKVCEVDMEEKNFTFSIIDPENDVERFVRADDFKVYIQKEEEKVSKFKVGDKVRIKKFKTRPYHWNIEGEMDKYSGRVVAISKIIGREIRICEDGEKWSWNESDFAPAEFARANLEDGMMLELRNGLKMIWLYGHKVGPQIWGSETHDDLTGFRYETDIVKVGYPDMNKAIEGSLERILNLDFSEILWERKEEKEISSEEAFAVLKEHYGCDVKIKE